MLPKKTDPQWIELVTADAELDLNSVAAKMMLMRVKLITKKDKNSPRISEAVETAYDFFSKNQDTLKADIEKIFR